MNPKKYRWSKVYESAEEELLDFLESRNIAAVRHDIESYDSLTLPLSNEITRIWGVEGNSTFTINGKRISMQPGDALDIPPKATCEITTALSDFAWYQ